MAKELTELEQIDAALAVSTPKGFAKAEEIAKKLTDDKTTTAAALKKIDDTLALVAHRLYMASKDMLAVFGKNIEEVKLKAEVEATAKEKKTKGSKIILAADEKEALIAAIFMILANAGTAGIKMADILVKLANPELNLTLPEKQTLVKIIKANAKAKGEKRNTVYRPLLPTK
jgi:precorrin isomerase